MVVGGPCFNYETLIGRVDSFNSYALRNITNICDSENRYMVFIMNRISDLRWKIFAPIQIFEKILLTK